MPFLPPNQQRQSTEDTVINIVKYNINQQQKCRGQNVTQLYITRLISLFLAVRTEKRRNSARSVVPGFEVDGVTEGGGDFSALAACLAFFDAALIAAAPSTQHTQAHNNDQVIQVHYAQAPTGP